MDLRDNPEEAAFRAELRAWLDANLPEEQRGGRGGAQRFDDAFSREWSRKLYDGGYAGLTWPKEYGGAGAPYSFQAIFYEEMARAAGAGAHRRDRPRHGGADDHGARHATSRSRRTSSKILSAEEIWCQGFSEPDAGSDLAAARTRAERKRRRLRRQRPEGLVVVRAHRRLLHPRHAQRPGRAALPGPDVPDRRHARARRRGAAAAADHRRGRVQRDLLHRRRGARREPARRGGRGLAGRDDDAAARARHARLRAHRRARGRRRPAARRRARARERRRRRARARRAGVDRAAGAPLHELPLARHAISARASPAPRARRSSCAGRSRTSG